MFKVKSPPAPLLQRGEKEKPLFDKSPQPPLLKGEQKPLFGKSAATKLPFEKGGLGGFEARRVLNICNVCGYCNGFCDVFDAAQRRPTLTAADLAHLAHLCHGCRNCLYSCQYAPPHEFAINVPRTLTQMRQHSDAAHIWPPALMGAFRHSAMTTLLLTGSATALLLGLIWLLEPNPQASGFYRVLPLQLMIWLTAIPLSWSLLALAIGWRRYWRFTRSPAAQVTWRILWMALQDVVLMRNLRGGGQDCNDIDERFSSQRRRLHQGLLAGLGLSFAATLTAMFYHHALGWSAPYPIVSIPVLFGTSGGIAIAFTTTGLLALQWRGDLTPTTRSARTANRTILLLLWTVAMSGLALLIGRETAAMTLLLALHLGIVIALFALLPYSKLVHAGYRIIALVIERIER
jgi:citrate/tricarballylate utilization protein